MIFFSIFFIIQRAGIQATKYDGDDQDTEHTLFILFMIFFYICFFSLRELVSKLRSMTETIKMLSTENVVLREENDGLIASRAKKGKHFF